MDDNGFIRGHRLKSDIHEDYKTISQEEFDEVLKPFFNKDFVCDLCGNSYPNISSGILCACGRFWRGNKCAKKDGYKRRKK